MTTQHTPGPWQVLDGHECLSILTTDSRTVAECFAVDSVADRETPLANARLIAAAPELLAALQRCRALLSPAFCAGDPSAEEMRSVVRAALAKVEG